MRPLKLGKLVLVPNFDLSHLAKTDPKVIRVKGWNAYIHNVDVGSITRWDRPNQNPEYQVRLHKFFCEADVEDYFTDTDGRRKWSHRFMDMKEYNGFTTIHDAGKAMKKLILKNILIVMV